MSARTQHRSDPDDEPAPATASAAMASFPRARASWSGLLKISLLAVPVKAYPAAATDSKIHFNQLHAGCGQRIRYEKHCPAHGKVDAGAIVSRYQYAPDQYLVLDEMELVKLRGHKERALLLERFLDPSRIDPALFCGRTLYLVPDGLAAQHPYTVVTEALQQRRKWALGRMGLSGQRHLVLVRPAGRTLAVHVLFYPAQLRSCASLETELPPESISPEEQKLAGLLVDSASGKAICWSDYRDDTAEQLKALLEARLQRQPVAEPAVEESPVLNLLDALRQSVASAVDAQPTAKVAASRRPKRHRSPRRSA